MTDDIVKRLRTYDWDTQDGAIRTLHEAADEIDRLRAAQEWRPIESAPRDGTMILAADGLNVGVAQCLDGVFVTVDISQWNITHWMPLPQPPGDGE